MSSVQFIFCERTGQWSRWATRLGRASQSFPSLVETRSLDECRARIVESPQSLVAIEVTSGNLPALSGWLGSLEDDFPHVRAVVLLARGLRPCEPLLREMGAIHAIVGLRQMAEYVVLARRHLRHAPKKQSRDDRPLTQQILDSLPWG